MYQIVEREGVIRIPPDKLDEDFDTLIAGLAQQSFEGRMNSNHELTLLITDIKPKGNGRILHGDGGIYQKVRYSALVYKPAMHEITDGTVVEVLKYGAFIRIGPLDGLLHISQIMDDHIDVDTANERLIGRETKRDLKVNDNVRVRIVAVSVNERNPRESKIGLTMRQVGLGKIEWLEDDWKKEMGGEEAEKKKPKGRRKTS